MWKTLIRSPVAATIAILISIAAAMFASNQALANPEMAKNTGQACAKCHTTPPALNDYGNKYKDSQKK